MPFDPWDQAALTATIERAVETTIESMDPLGPKIAPLVPVQDRKIKKEAIEIEAFGKGQFKARNATPPLYAPRIKFTREMIELALLEEMTEIEEDEWHDLTSPDARIRNARGIDILRRTRILQLRNERLTEWMRWQAFRDDLQVQYSDDGSWYRLIYGVPEDQTDASATIEWTDRDNATPITDIRAIQKLLGRRTGARGLMVHMNSDTHEELQYSAEVKDKLTPTGRTLLLPEEDDIVRLLYNGSKIIISDHGVRPDGSEDDRSIDSHDLYLPDGKVLITTPYELDGERIADVPDGRVAVSTQGAPPLVWKQGMQTETMVDVHAKTHYVRQASARIVRLNKPSAFVWFTAYTP